MWEGEGEGEGRCLEGSVRYEWEGVGGKTNGGRGE